MSLLWLSLAFLTGILLASLLPLSVLTWSVFVGVTFLLFLLSAFLKRSPRRLLHLSLPIPSSPVPYPLVFLVLFFGALRYQIYQPRLSTSSLAYYNDRSQLLIVEGVIVRPPEERDNVVMLIIQAQQLRPEAEATLTPVTGRLLAQAQLAEDWHYGDLVRLTGSLETPTEGEGFSYRKYLALQRVYSIMPRPRVALIGQNRGNWLLGILYKIREQAVTTVYHIFPDPEASLMAGILLGSESGIPEDVQAAFTATGTSHIIAISGANITVLVAFFTSLFGRVVGRRWGLLSVIPVIILYTILVGGSATVVRAAIMGCLSLLAVQLGRRQDGLNTLAISAAGMTLFKPDIPWDVGFQLSFFATLGMVLYAEPLRGVFTRVMGRFLPQAILDRLVGPVSVYLLMTLAAQMFTLPIIVYHFGRFSLVSLLANPLILPVQPLVMILGGLSVILGLIFQPAGQIAAYLAWPFVAYTIRLVEGLAQVPQASLNLGRIDLIWVIMLEGLLILWVTTGQRLRGWMVTLKPAIPFTILLGLVVLAWQAVFSAPDGRLRVTLLNVGSGDAVLIQTPGGRSLLIDGGPSARKLSDALGRRLPVEKRLDWLVVAAPGNEQLQALPETIDRYPPGQILWAGATHESRSARRLQEKIATARLPLNIAQPGQALDLGSGARLEVLAAGERGGILLLEWHNFRALLPLGMADDDILQLRMGQAVGRVTALMLAGNGEASLNPPEWISALNPQVVLLSVAADDVHGLPSPATLDALVGYTLLRTDLNGWIELTTDGVQMWVEVEKR